MRWCFNIFINSIFCILEISESNGTVRIDYLEEGIMFPFGVDNDGKLMFVIKCKLHFKSSKDPEECKKCAVYWFERMERYTFYSYLKFYMYLYFVAD